MGKLDGKVALVTGGGAGIGEATSVLFAKEGAKVVIADCVAESGEATVKKIKAIGGDATFVEADVSKAVDVEKMVRTTVDTYGKLDVLFNNAGVLGKWVLTVEYDEEEYDRIVDINLKGVWLGMKYAIPEMIKVGGGSIINTSSHIAWQPQIGTAVYCAAKAAVLQLTRVTALEYIRKNIRINWLAPGFVHTPMVDASLKEDPDGFAQIVAQTPLRRWGEPEEIARAALFLASDESSYTTGAGVVADGGIHLYCNPVNPGIKKIWW